MWHRLTAIYTCRCLTTLKLSILSYFSKRRGLNFVAVGKLTIQTDFVDIIGITFTGVDIVANDWINSLMIDLKSHDNLCQHKKLSEYKLRDCDEAGLL